MIFEKYKSFPLKACKHKYVLSEKARYHVFNMTKFTFPSQIRQFCPFQSFKKMQLMRRLYLS